MKMSSCLTRFYCLLTHGMVHYGSAAQVVPFTPSLEDRSLTNDSFISDCSIDHYWSGRYTKVPQIMGFMDEETITFLNCEYKISSFQNFRALLEKSQLFKNFEFCNCN